MGALQFYRCGFLGVRYLEAILYKSRREFESRGPTRASQAYEISGFLSDFCCRPRKYTDMRGSIRTCAEVGDLISDFAL